MVKGTALALAALSGFEIARRLYRDARLFDRGRVPVLSWDPADYGYDRASVDEIQIHVDGNDLYGWYCRAASPIASAVYCHGNGGSFAVDLEAIRHCVEAGISVLVFDYRGYGKSTGRATVRGVVRDTLAAAAKHDEIRPPGIPSILYGFSLGGAIAARAAERKPDVSDALVLQSTFTSLREIVRCLYPSVPLHLLCIKEMDTHSILGNVPLPTVVIHGTGDAVVPSSMGEQLYEAAPNARELVLVEGAGHRDLFVTAPERIVTAIRNLALTASGRPADDDALAS